MLLYIYSRYRELMPLIIKEQSNDSEGPLLVMKKRSLAM
jgi:hypothetical protein